MPGVCAVYTISCSFKTFSLALRLQRSILDYNTWCTNIMYEEE